MDTAQTRKKRVLVADGHAALTHLVKLLLEKTGEYIVEEENQSGAVVSSVQRFAPDLLLLEAHMPGLECGEALATIKADSRLRRTAIVFLLPLVSAPEACGCKGNEDYPCLAKPVTREALVRTIEESLERGRLVWPAPGALVPIT